jgi:hypothetical protein
VTVVKNQHYVAQGYLRAFADTNEQLFVFDKQGQKVFHTGVRNVASEKFFYDLPPPASDPDGDPQAIEKFLAQTVDADFPQAIQALLDGVAQQGRIDAALKGPLGCFLAVQLTRTRSQRDRLRQLSNRLAAELLKRAGGSLDPDQFRLDEKHAAKVQARMFLDPRAVGLIATVLSRHIWVVGISKPGQSFYTSDNPVVRASNATYTGPLGMNGLASPGIQIAFPLTPKYVLLLLERSFFSRTFGEHDLQAIPFTDQGVIGCNSMQVFESRRQVYCLVDCFDLARELCATHLEICDPDRVDVEVVSYRKPPGEG